MRALLLAGGLGTRLRPLSFSIPKPLLPVGDKSIIELLLKALRGQGVREVVLAVGYRADLVRAYLSQAKIPGLRIDFVEEKKRMGTAGPLGLARRFLKANEPFLVMNSDILTRFPFRKFWEAHRRSGAEATLAVRPYHYRLPYGVLKTDGPWLRSIQEKPTFSFTISSGIYCMSPSIFSYLPPHRYFDIPDLLKRVLSRGGRVGTYAFTAPWKAIEELNDFQGIKLEDWR